MTEASVQSQSQIDAGGTRPPAGRALTLQPDAYVRHELGLLLRENGFAVDEARDVRSALEAAAFNAPEVILCEISGMERDAASLLTALHRVRPEAALIVYSRQLERRTGPDRRLGHAFEYLDRTAAPHEIVSAALKGVAFCRERSATLAEMYDQPARMQSKLEWLLWKEKSKSRDRIAAERTLINNIKHSLSQGLGVGGLATLIDLMALASRSEGERVSVCSKMFQQLLDSGEAVREWFDSLETITGAFTRECEVRPMSAEEAQTCIRNAIAQTERLRQIKGQTVNEDLLPAALLRGEPAALELCLRELLTNAYKYSPAGSVVNVTGYRSSNGVSIIVLNDLELAADGAAGVPSELENAVFEPFFRMKNTYDERYRGEELGMGIGLTIVQNTLNQFGGAAFLYEVNDHSSSGNPRRRVAAELALQPAPPRSVQETSAITARAPVRPSRIA